MQETLCYFLLIYTKLAVWSLLLLPWQVQSWLRLQLEQFQGEASDERCLLHWSLSRYEPDFADLVQHTSKTVADNARINAPPNEHSLCCHEGLCLASCVGLTNHIFKVELSPHFQRCKMTFMLYYSWIQANIVCIMPMGDLITVQFTNACGRMMPILVDGLVTLTAECWACHFYAGKLSLLQWIL